MFRKPWLFGLTIALVAATAFAGTFGKVVAIGGEASDLALDESRGVLYIANFTANRIDVMTLASNRIQTSINVPAQPSSVSLSPDNHWLLVAHYGNNTAPASQTNALTLIDLTANNSRQTFSLPDPPLGVAFGLDNKALVVTSTSFILFDPSLGTTQVLQTVAQVATQAIPQPAASFPGNIVQASVAVSRDGLTVAGFGGTSPYLLFRYNVPTHTITSAFYTSSPAAGPRVVSLSDDGSQTSMAWWMSDPNFVTTAEFSDPSGAPAGGLLNLGSHVIDSSRNLVYAQIPSTSVQSGNTSTPILQVLDSDNLTVREQLLLAENLSGKSVLTGDHNTMYSISDSGVTVLPVGNLASYPRLTTSSQDVVFRGNFCDRSVTRQKLVISDPGGGNTPFTITPSISGISVSPSSGITPATVTVTVDPNAFSSQKGTVAASLSVTSKTGVNPAQTVRVLINSQDPSQRGAFVDIPGTVVDLLADPKRNVYYILRQDKNQVLIFDGSNNSQTATLRTCTKPMGMAITFDQQYLLIGCDHAHIMNMYDLDTLQAQPYITMNLEYIQSIAASSNAILASFRNGGGGSPGITMVDLVTRTVRTPTSLGVWQNKLGSNNSVLAASSNGGNVLIASDDGSVWTYDATVGSFTASRHDFTSLSGSYAASSFGQYVVGNHLLDASAAPVRDFNSIGSPSGFAFVNQANYFTAAAAATAGAGSPGTIAQVDLSSGTIIQPTPMVEAPLLGNVTLGLGSCPGSSSTTTTSGTTTTTVVCSTVGNVTTLTTSVCTGVGTGSSSCSTTSTQGPPNTSVSGFIRSLAPLPNQNAIINLTTSGFTVLPWSYAASVAPPQITKIVSAADMTSPVAPGGLISILGNQLSATNLASSEIPLATALANSCLTVNGQPMPLVFVSPQQINAQMPALAIGNVTINVHTPGGVSDNFNLTVQPTAPAIFLSGSAGPETNLPVVVRSSNNLLVTDSNPIHRSDSITIYLTGCGQTSPQVGDGLPAPMDPLAEALSIPTVFLGGTQLPVTYGGLAPGQVGVCQINASVPSNTPTGLGMPLLINQGGSTQSVALRVVN